MSFYVTCFFITLSLKVSPHLSGRAAIYVYAVAILWWVYLYTSSSILEAEAESELGFTHKQKLHISQYPQRRISSQSEFSIANKSDFPTNRKPDVQGWQKVNQYLSVDLWEVLGGIIPTYMIYRTGGQWCVQVFRKQIFNKMHSLWIWNLEVQKYNY